MSGNPAIRFWRTVVVMLQALISCGMQNVAHAEKMSLVFIIDGMGFGAAGYGVAKTPFMDSLRQGTFSGGGYHGASADDAFAGGVLGTPTQQPTISGPGWSTILTGVWVNRHLVTDNACTSGDFVKNPPYLQTLKANLPNIQTLSVVSWPPVDDCIISAANATRYPIDFHQSTNSDAKVVSTVVAHIAALKTNRPASVFVGFEDVDAAGHGGGSSSPGYRTAIENTDKRIGTILRAVKNRPSFAEEDWLFVITADHGHLAEGGHGGQSALERTIPFIIAGKHVQQGKLLSVPGSVSHADVAPTVLKFHQVPLPGYYSGTPRGERASAIRRDDLIGRE